MILRSLTLLAAMVLVVACASDGDSRFVESGPANFSAIEDIPLPEGSTPVSRDDGVEHYRISGASFDDLYHWYERQLPAGEDWNEWQWCEAKVAPEAVAGIIFHRQQTREDLGVLMFRGDHGAHDLFIITVEGECDPVSVLLP